MQKNGKLIIIATLFRHYSALARRNWVGLGAFRKKNKYMLNLNRSLVPVFPPKKDVKKPDRKNGFGNEMGGGGGEGGDPPSSSSDSKREGEA